MTKDIKYLTDFKLENEHSDSVNTYWVFSFVTFNSTYKIVCVVKRNNTSDTWGLRVESFWGELDKRKTPGAGMEYSIDIEEIKGYDNFIAEANRKLNNSPITDSNLYHDDYNFMMTKEIIKELIRLIIDYPKIEGMNNSQYYNDLKKIYQDTVDYINKNYPADGDKQMLIYKLNSLDSMDNFIEIEKMSNTPEDETFS